MAVWRDHVLPRIVDKACARRDIAEPRRRTLSGLSGDVVEVGFGSGHNLAYYPSEVDQFHRTGSAPSEAAGALVVDICRVEQRQRDGTIPAAPVIDRNVLEWRLDPASPTAPADALRPANHRGLQRGLQLEPRRATLRSLGLHNAPTSNTATNAGGTRAATTSARRPWGQTSDRRQFRAVHRRHTRTGRRQRAGAPPTYEMTGNVGGRDNSPIGGHGSLPTGGHVMTR